MNVTVHNESIRDCPTCEVKCHYVYTQMCIQSYDMCTHLSFSCTNTNPKVQTAKLAVGHVAATVHTKRRYPDM